MRAISEAHVSTEGTANRPLRPRRGPSAGTHGPGPRLWRGVLSRPSPQSFPARCGAVGGLSALGLLLIGATPPTVGPVGLEAHFNDANSLKDAEACREALPLYAQVTAEAASPHWAAAHYNAGVCCEELGDPVGARMHYTSILDAGEAIGSSLRADSAFRRALLDVVEAQPNAETRADLWLARRLTGEPLGRALVDLQRARLLAAGGQLRAAARVLERAALQIERLGPRDGPRDRRGRSLDWYRAEAAVLRGDLLSAFSARISLGLRAPRPVASRLRERADGVEAAQAHYLEATAVGASPWAQLALRGLGDAYAEAAGALEAVHTEALDPAAGGKPGGPARDALALWLAGRRAAPWQKAAEAYGLCRAVERELGGAPRVDAACAAALVGAIARIRALEPDGSSRAGPLPASVL